MVTFDIVFKKPVSFLAFSRAKLLLVDILRILVVIAEIYVCSIFLGSLKNSFHVYTYEPEWSSCTLHTSHHVMSKKIFFHLKKLIMHLITHFIYLV